MIGMTNQITRQQLADLIGAKSPTYINELEKTGRAIRAPDGKHWLKAESLAAYKAAKDPSKQGVADRHAAARAASAPPKPAPAARHEHTNERHDAPEADLPTHNASQSGSAYQNARAVKEKFLALEAKRAYEVAIGTLRDAREVEGIVATAMVEVRQRLENLAHSIAPIVAAQTDEAAVRATLRDAFDHALKSASQHFERLKKENPTA